MRAISRHAFLVAALVLCVWAPTAEGKPKPDCYREMSGIILDGHQVINVVDDFLDFWDEARCEPPARQRRLWMRRVENKHRNYFDRAVYQNADRQTRAAMRQAFLERAPEEVEKLREFNREAVDRVLEGVLNFKARFPDYRQQRDIYVGLSLAQFDGALRPVRNDAGVPDTICLGADMLADCSDDEVRIAIAHELFHAWHFSHLFRHPCSSQLRMPHTLLMAEGMAVAGSEAVYPFRRRSAYLRFSEEQLAAQENGLAANSRTFLRLMQERVPLAASERWFWGEADARTPLRGGYLLGYEVTRRALATRRLEELVRMSPAELLEQAEQHLTAIATNEILLVTH